ncbi:MULTISPECIES: CHY zinc finger protein [unclassified Agrococcus]|uniref:CHY zinc finger protein n=1 Tax=unclassified Agrococcus TaxID=2615065 RepID=UPI00362291CA
MSQRERPPVLGRPIDDETRCVHWSSPLDVVAIRLACCDAFFPCHACHAETADHAASRWPEDARDERAVLCGVCGHRLTIDEYGTAASCPACRAPFNPGCALHWHLYFEGPPPAAGVERGAAGDERP